MRYDLLGFDLDGTLVDTAEEIAAAANAALADVGVAPRPPAEIAALIGSGTRELVRRLRERALEGRPPQAGAPAYEALLARFDAHYAEVAGRGARPYPGARETLARLRAGGVRLACVTNKEARFAARVLRSSGLDDCFDLVVGGDTLPERKPHPAVFAHVLAALGGRPATSAHVGDSRIDVETARGAGVAAWAGPWGYNGGASVAEAAPDRLFHSLPAIAAHVLAANTAQVAPPRPKEDA